LIRPNFWNQRNHYSLVCLKNLVVSFRSHLIRAFFVSLEDSLKLHWEYAIIISRSKLIKNSWVKLAERNCSFLLGCVIKQKKKMCCVSARRLSIHKTYNKFRISLLNNCKKDFQFHTERNFFTLNIRFFLHDLLEFHVFEPSWLPVAFQTP
jgi:hypothetical protein